jgi:hypothetical protein
MDRADSTFGPKLLRRIMQVQIQGTPTQRTIRRLTVKPTRVFDTALAEEDAKELAEFLSNLPLYTIERAIALVLEDDDLIKAGVKSLL